MTALARIDLDRLAKFCGMLGSSHDGERAAAALKADALVRAAGMTWPEILNPAAPTPRPADPPPRAMSPGEILARHGDRLTDWEKHFLASLIRWRRDWTPKQRTAFEVIRERVAGYSK